jgi:hypothetical protein
MSITIAGCGAVAIAHGLASGYWYHLATQVWYLTPPLTLLGLKHLSRKNASACASCLLARGRKT